MNTLIPGAPLRSLSPTSNEYQRAEGVSRAAKPARVARFSLDAPEHSGTIPGARGDILTPGVALTSNLAVIFTLNQHTTIKGSGTRCSKRKNASAVLTGRCDVVSDWAACSAITTATPHRSSGAPVGRNGWSAGEVCSGSPIAELVPRRLVSASFENASRIRPCRSVRVFGQDACCLSL